MSFNGIHHMSVWQHLGEARRRLLISIYVLIACTIVGAFAINPFVAWFTKPVGTLVFLRPTEAFAFQAKIAVAIGIFIGVPIFLYQLWSFISIGLELKEKTYIRTIVPLSYLLFVAGVAMAALLIFPRAVEFFLSMTSEHLKPMISAESYLDFFFRLCFIFGLLFQLPLVMHFLAKIGILRYDFMTSNRRVFYLLFFVFATLVNGTPEVFTQVLIALVGIVLFEASVFTMRWEARKKARDL